MTTPKTALADRIEATKRSWLPIAGHVVNVTFNLAEADMICAALRAAPAPCDVHSKSVKDLIRGLMRYADGRDLRGKWSDELEALKDDAHKFLTTPQQVVKPNTLTTEDIYANAYTTLMGFRDELTEQNIKFICDQISRKVALALSSAEKKRD